MANRRTKIEQMGLDRRIQELVTEGLSARRIAAQVKIENPDAKVSESSIARYVGKVRNAATDEAFKTIRDHVDRVVPEDLKALEEMEGQCLEWAREAGKDRVDRMADAAVAIMGKVQLWRWMLISDTYFTGKDEDIDVLVRKIIRECLIYMAREDRLQLQRDKAMNTAIKIIDLKLRQAGLLDDEGKSPIYIVDRTGGKRPEDNKEDHSTYKPYIVGSKKDG